MRLGGKPEIGAVDALRRQRFLEQVNAAYTALRADLRTWEAIEGERRAWNVTLPEGLGVVEERARHEARSGRRRSPKRR